VPSIFQDFFLAGRYKWINPPIFVSANSVGALKNRVGTFENRVGISQNRVGIFENRVGIFSGLLGRTKNKEITNCKSNNSTKNLNLIKL
jgi:hypothetical protein